MFTGIIEAQSQIIKIEKELSNIHFWLSIPESWALYIDQSIAHNGVCLTVVEIDSQTYRVTAIEETLNKTALNHWEIGTVINLERSIQVGHRLDGHFVQGHVDTTGTLARCTEENGSWKLRVTFDEKYAHFIIPRGSIALEGISLTLAEVGLDWFEVAIIPYTWANTNLRTLKIHQKLNIEWDILGKYMVRWKDVEAKL